MTPIDTALHELAGLRCDRDPIVSVYLNTRWSDEHQRDRMRLFVQDRLRWARSQGFDGANGEALEKSLARIERYTEDLFRQAVDVDANGVAIFACDGLGLFRTMTFGQPFKEQFSLGDSPHLLQLARHADDYESVIVAVVDGGGARVFETALGEVIGDSTIEHQAPSRHKMGGWSQLHFQRHVRRQIERNHKEAAEHVTFLFDEDPSSHVILVGPARVLATFETVLPQRVCDKIMCRLHNPRDRGPYEGKVRDEVMAQVVDELLEHERKLEERDVDTVVGEAMRGGLAVLGPQDVILAANEGRIHRLLIEDGYSQTGWRCKNCNAIGMAASASCGYCGQEVTTVELGEELARRVIENDGEIDVLDRRARLHHYHGIGALLRHRGTARQAIGWAVEQPVF